MNPRVDLSEFLSAYIIETDEHLALANARLLALEVVARRGEVDPRAVRDVFRALHTIKGLSSMVGVEAIVGLAHRMETVLRAADRRQGLLGAHAVDVLLQGLRTMEQRVRAVEKGAPAAAVPPTLLNALDALDAEDASKVADRPNGLMRLTLDPALAVKLDPFERELLLKGAAEGRRALRIDYAPSPARAAQGHNITTVRERLGALGEIVRVLPLAVARSEQAPNGIVFALLLLTAASDDELASVSGVLSEAITPLVAGALKEALSPPARREPEEQTEEADAPRRNVLRVDVARVDDAMERLAALLVTRSRLTQAIAQLAAGGADTRELGRVAQQNAQQLRDLRASILQVRMVSLAEILDRVPLIVRSLVRSSGKEVRVETATGGAELDKAVAEHLFPALVHLLRNAVDHGIERSDERAASGKPVEGSIRIVAVSRANARLELSVIDDGRGVDREQVGRRDGGAIAASDGDLLDILCRPGLSTRDEATTTSGRGLGMDIVRRIVVDQLGGELSMQTRRGQGTTFTIQVPLTVAIVDAFVVECAGQRFVVPVPVVEEILDIATIEVVSPPQAPGDPMGSIGIFERRGQTLTVVSLAALLGLERGTATGPPTKVLVVRRAGESVGFLLDRILSQEEAVVRPLVDPLLRVPGISAATDLGDGRPALVLDLPALVGRARRRDRGSRRALPGASLPKLNPSEPLGPAEPAP